jgi:hypothetical protein
MPVLNGNKGVGVVERTARPGEKLQLTAAGATDPDGDRLSFHWFVYPEAGTDGRDVPLSDATAETSTPAVPADAAGKTVHVVLEVTDSGRALLLRPARQSPQSVTIRSLDSATGWPSGRCRRAATS